VDLLKNYSVAENYVIRSIEFPADLKKNIPASITIFIICGDEIGTARGIKILSCVLLFLKSQ